MENANQGGVIGGDVSWLDDDAEPVTAGDSPPSVPEDAPAVASRLVPDDADVTTAGVVRVTLGTPSDRYVRGFLEELRNEVDVFGSTHGTEAGPEEPDRFDVVIAMEYDLSKVVGALAGPDNVAAVTGVPTPVDDGDDRPGGEADESDVTAALEALENEVGPEGDSEAADESVAGVDGPAPGGPAASGDAELEAGTADAATVDPGGAPPTTSDDADADGDAASVGEPDDGAASSGGANDGVVDKSKAAESGNHPAFEEIKGDVERVEYDDLVDELAATDMPGDYDDDADLEPVIAGDDEPEGGSVVDPATSPASGGDDAMDIPPAEEVGESRNGHGEALSPDAVVDALVTAVEEDALADEQRRTIASALDDGPPPTLQVKLDHLQREIDELTAYKDSLEAFIDEYGSGDELIERIKETRETFAADVQRIAATVQALRNELENTQGTVVEHGEQLEETDEELAAVEDRLTDLDDVERRVKKNSAAVSKLSDVERRVGENASRLEALDDVKERVEENAFRLEALDEVEGRVEENASRLEALEEVEKRVSALEELQAEVADLSDQVADLEESVAEGDEPDADVETRLAEVEETLGELSTRVQAIDTETDDAVPELLDRMTEVEQRLDEQDDWRQQLETLLAALVTGGEATDE